MLILRTEGRINPVGIDCVKPEFSWKLTGDEPCVRQASYQLIIKKWNGDCVWDSGTVYSDISTEIYYNGSPLEPCTKYAVHLTVYYSSNKSDRNESFFETGLMLAEEKTLGDDAVWIGADELTLDAASACYFDLRTDVTIPPSASKAGIIFGANDFRLMNKNYNVWGKDGPVNYFKYEIDITGLKKEPEETAALNIYVVGMPVLGQAKENNPNEPDFSIPIPETILSKNNAHEKMSISIDTLSNANQVSCRINGMAVDEKRQLNPLGNTHDYNTYPNLNEIGFSAAAGEEVLYENLQILNPGPYSCGVLFGEHTGATYDIFRGIKGVKVLEGGKILVGADSDVLIHADPSYGSAPMLRSEFEAEKELLEARLYVTAQGIYEAWINGKKISEDWFNPGNSEYRERIAYHTYDVTGLIQNGNNAIGVQLAEGWWSGYQTFLIHNYNYYGDRQAFMAKLVLKYKDGTVKKVVTDTSNWSYYGRGPLEYASFFQGERYNAVKETDGWLLPGFAEKGWRKAAVIPTKEPFSNYRFMTRLDEPIRVINTITAKSLQKSSEYKDRSGNYSYIYDMGENVLGVPHIEIPKGFLEQGQKLILRYAEILYPSQLKEYQEAGIANMMMAENYRAALSTDFYLARDGRAAVIEPHYTYHGYRYLEISGLKEALPISAVKMHLLSSSRITSTYESSNSLVNRLFKNTQNSQNSNFISLPTDCPQRNERLGWTGDAQVFSRAASYHGDVYNFYRQWLYTLRDEQFENGALPVFAPSYRRQNDKMQVPDANLFFGGISWDAALVVIPYNLYLQYGRKEIIRENFDAIRKYLLYLKSNPMRVMEKEYAGLTNKTGILADWLSIEATDATLINNAVYVYLLNISSKMAEVIGNHDLAKNYKEDYLTAKAQWNELYVGKEGYTNDIEGNLADTQASYATPLRYGVFSEENKAKAALNYKETIRRTLTEKGNYTIKTGFSGTPNLVPVLSELGFDPEAYKLFESTEYASWLYPVINGATSIWERWNSYTVEGGFNGNNSMNSFNHFSLGAIAEWMMGYQLGIMHDENQPGYKHFILQPHIGGTMTYAYGTFDSPYGIIYSGWTKGNDILWETYHTVIPANTGADLYLPASQDVPVQIDCEGVKYLGLATHHETMTMHFELLSGRYAFRRTEQGVLVSDGRKVSCF